MASIVDRLQDKILENTGHLQYKLSTMDKQMRRY